MPGMHDPHAICSDCVKFFSIFVNDSFETNYLMIQWTDFHKFSPYGRYLVVGY